MQVLGWRPVAGSSPAARRGARWRAGLTPRPDLQHALMPARDKPIKFHLTVITVSTANDGLAALHMSPLNPGRHHNNSERPRAARLCVSAGRNNGERTAFMEFIGRCSGCSRGHHEILDGYG